MNALNKEKAELAGVYKASLRAHAEEELERQKEELTNKMQRDRERFNLSKESERKKMRDKLVEESRKKLGDELSKKEIAIKQQLRNEFEVKMKNRIQQHEDELKKKKIDLELEMQRKIKQVLR